MNSLKNELLIICDAGPLIFLAKIGQLKLLKALAKEVWIPTAVWNEVVINSELHHEIEEIKISLSNCIHDPDPVLERAFQLEVDPGEAAAIALAMEHPYSCLLIDDMTGRMIAQRQGLHITGTLGILIRAKHIGLIPQLKPLFDNLKIHGWFISDELIHQALVAVNEK
ncbi:MAG: DUF3368 domain-containing protein [Verrucomicrobiae bacterium]|nr:DUF3368 domain-containing protein [Verrucomicrobiae bacterium]